jgi:hypothetical protein
VRLREGACAVKKYARTGTLAACLFLFSLTGHGQAICPWLNAATASGVLGGAATAVMNLHSAGAGTCRFQLTATPADGSLQIAVSNVEHAGEITKALASDEVRCVSTPAPLKAIGNEAVVCAEGGAAGQRELVVGRVRNSVFTVELILAPPRAGAAPATDEAAEKAESIAEQVAGSLF